MKPITSIYKPKYIENIVYMLHASEYKVLNFLVLVWKTKDFSSIKTKKTLQKTNKIKILFVVSYLISLLVIAAGILLIILALTHHLAGGVFFGIAVILLYPFILPHVLALVFLLTDYLFFKPYNQPQASITNKISSQHK